MKCVAILLVLLPVIFANPVDKRFLKGFHLDLGHTFESVENYVKEHILTPGMEAQACTTACKAALPGGLFYCSPVCDKMVAALNGN